MNLQLNHKYELVVGQPFSFYEGIPTVSNFATAAAPIVNEGNVQNFINTKDGDGLVLTNHHIEFEIDKSKESGKESKITIYNVSDGVREYFNAKSGSKPAIILRAGYESEDDITNIFQGEVFKVTDSFSGHTRITELLLRSGYANIQEAYTVKSFRAGTKASDIIRSVAEDLKLPTGTIFLSEGRDVIIQKPVIVNAKSFDFLAKFTKEYEASVFIEDRVLKVLPDNYVERDGRWVFEISAELGNMIGSPSLSTDSESTQENQAANRESLHVTTTLNGAYSIGDYVALTSKYHNGVYEIQSIRHVGSYEGNNWFSKLDIKPVDGWEIRR